MRLEEEEKLQFSLSVCLSVCLPRTNSQHIFILSSSSSSSSSSVLLSVYPFLSLPAEMLSPFLHSTFPNQIQLNVSPPTKLGMQSSIRRSF